MAGLFAKIIKGEIPSYKLYEDEWTFAFITRDQIHAGHSLVIPKVEVDYFADCPEPYYSAVFKAAKPLAKAIHAATGCKRVGTIIAGWEVPHFHYHLVPMFGFHDLDPRLGKVRAHEDNLAMQAKIVDALKRG